MNHVYNPSPKKKTPLKEPLTHGSIEGSSHGVFGFTAAGPETMT